MPNLFKAWTELHEARTNLHLAEESVADYRYLDAEGNLVDAERHFKNAEAEAEGMTGYSVRASLIALREQIDQARSGVKGDRGSELSRSASS